MLLIFSCTQITHQAPDSIPSYSIHLIPHMASKYHYSEFCPNNREKKAVYAEISLKQIGLFCDKSLTPMLIKGIILISMLHVFRLKH